jgi:hypothetical protein
MKGFVDDKRRRPRDKCHDYSTDPQHMEDGLDFLEGLVVNPDCDTSVCSKGTQLQMNEGTLRRCDGRIE